MEYGFFNRTIINIEKLLIDQILTDRPDLLQFKENLLELEGGAAQPIGLRFAPVTHPGIAELLVFINDEEDKNEETFRITAEYKLMVE